LVSGRIGVEELQNRENRGQIRMALS